VVNGKGGMVLIIEDDPGVARLQQKRLERAGYTAVSAGTAEEGMRILAQGGVELILLDYRLPDNRTGLDVFAQLQATGHNVPVIMVTGFSDEATVIKALRAGVRDFVTKSVQYLDYLPDAVERVFKQVRTERKLAESEKRLANTIASAMDAIIAMDHEGKIVEFNPAAERMFGHLRVDAIGTELAQLIVPLQLREGHRNGLSRYLLTEEGPVLGKRLELTALRADGSEFPVELTVTRIHWDGPPVFTGFVRDITQRKQAEERLKEQATLLDIASNAIMTCDLEGRILFWNKGAERLYGWSEREAIGKTDSDLLFKEESSQTLEARNRVVEHGEWTREVRQSTKDGKEVIVESRWTLVRDHKGRPKSRLVINTDITEKKKLEAQFLRAQRMESIGTLAGGIAHDLNNVLTPIIMAVDLLHDIIPEEARLSLLNPLRASAERGAEMVKQILSFARGTEGQRIELQIKHVIRDVDQMLRHTLPKTIELRTSLTKELWAVFGDATQFYQVLMNLCVNARDAMPGGGRLTVTAKNVTLDEGSARGHFGSRPGPYVVLNVADTGTGIPAEILDKIFDPFFTTKEVGKGTGLGLSTTSGIVRSHGGFINVESEAGKGACFSIYLPAVQTAPISGREKSHRQFPSGHGELILVVDDEVSIRAMTKATLEAYGYRVLTACDGAEAVDLFAKHLGKIKLVLTDMVMPIMDGPATVRALEKLDPRVPIVAVSGMMGDDGAADVGSLAAHATLSKPYTMETLLTTLARVLDPGDASGGKQAMEIANGQQSRDGFNAFPGPLDQPQVGSRSWQPS